MKINKIKTFLYIVLLIILILLAIIVHILIFNKHSARNIYEDVKEKEKERFLTEFADIIEKEGGIVNE